MQIAKNIVNGPKGNN